MLACLYLHSLPFDIVSMIMVYRYYTVRVYNYIDGGDRNARDLRSMAQEERIRAGEDQESVLGGFEKYTKVLILLHSIGSLRGR